MYCRPNFSFMMQSKKNLTAPDSSFKQFLIPSISHISKKTTAKPKPF